MPEILNQDEVDSLLELVHQGEGEAGGSGPPADEASAGGGEQAQAPAGFNTASLANVQVYDFKRPERVSKEQVTALEALHEAFARNVSASLSGYLRTIVEVRLISVEQFTYAEFTMSLPSPTSFNLLSCEPLEGNMILEVNPSILFPIIDRLLGGGKSEPFIPDRPFTNIELGLVNTILGRILDQLDDTWENIRKINFKTIETESNPFLMQIVAPNEPIVLLSFEILMGEHSGMINLCIPFKVIEPIMPEFSQSNWFVAAKAKATDATRECIRENIANAVVSLSAVLAETRISLGDLLALRVGDYVDTGKAAGTAAMLRIEGKNKFRGQPRQTKGKVAFEITHVADPREPAV
jgi:flagellar motor switch protein FliM